MRTFLRVVCGLLVAGCGPDASLELGDGAADDAVELIEAELNASLLLSYVNSAEATATSLTSEAQIDARAAKGIVGARDGADGKQGTADDQPFQTIAQLDAVPWVGPATLAKLDMFAAAHLGGGGVTADGVAFTEQQAKDALTAVNGPELGKIGLYATAYNKLLIARPFATIAQVAAVPYVGPSTMTLIRTYAQRHPSVGAPVTPQPAGCTGQGGSYDGVLFTRAEECHAVDFLNRARFSEMAALPDFARLVAYENGPEGVYFQSSDWTQLSQYAGFTGIGATAISALKTAAASWSPNGLEHDTVSSTWTGRAALANRPIYLDRVFVTKLFPKSHEVETGYQCAELRDAPTATSYLIACVPPYICDGGVCWSMPAQSWAAVRGTLRLTSMPGAGGYRLIAALPGARSPQLP